MRTLANRSKTSILQYLVTSLILLVFLIFWLINYPKEISFIVILAFILSYFFIGFIYKILGPAELIIGDRKDLVINKYFGKKISLRKSKITSVDCKLYLLNRNAGRITIHTNETIICLRNVEYPKDIKKILENKE